MLLPPSETKRDGGSGRFSAGRLSFPVLTAPRRAVLDALLAVSTDADVAMRALHLGSSQRSEVDRNRAIRRAPVLPAMQRYDGVLYDGLDVPTVGADAEAWLSDHVAIASALFGLLRAGDPIPVYRFSASAALPGIALGRHWSKPLTRVLARQPEWVLDLRSAAYAALGAAPADAARLHVETIDPGGRRRALNHFNKLHKGLLVRALATTGASVQSRSALLDWAADIGLPLEERGDHDVTLVVAQTAL